MARANIVRQLSGNTAAPGPQTALPGADAAASGASGASGATGKPPSPPIAKPVNARPSADPVTFVGAFHDETGSSVLYEYREAIYPGHVGTTLLNGWKVTGVDGFSVSVSDGKRKWKEPIRSAAPALSPSTNAVRSLIDLGAPLPPGGSMPAMPMGGPR
ncbi:hypothetical protein ACV229_16510 [Burkholderia sp. MR1-5-21]